jgi:methylenetetrahydrofolate dehydrogenase (NADP+) / methenyltetrahydrofolate cyclohydrolase
MTARIIDGAAVAAALRARTAERVAALPYRPGLTVVLVGNDAASSVYVRTKDRAANATGIAAQTMRLPAQASQSELLDCRFPHTSTPKLWWSRSTLPRTSMASIR